MRAILTPLFIFATLITWGQDFELPFAQTPEHVIASAVDAWNASQTSEDAEVIPAVSPKASFARDNRNTIISTQRGIWSEAATWDCDCVPTGNDNVIVNHEVSFVSDAEFSSMIVNASGTLIDLNNVTLTFDGNLVSSGAHLMGGAELVANGIAANQVLAANLAVAKLTVLNRTTLTVEGALEVTGHVNVDDSTLDIDPSGDLILSENEWGRATVQRTSGGEVTGLVTRQMQLPATPNRNMAFVEQRITTGLEGVTVNDFVGDIPTWGFAGSDDPAGFSNIGYWSGTDLYNYHAIGDASDALPVWEGIYLALAPAESYTLTFSGTLPSEDMDMEIPGDAFTALFGNPTNANVDLNVLTSQFPAGGAGMDCWNTNTLQYDHFINGVCTNGLNSTLQPNTTCQFLPSEAVTLTLASSQTLPNGTESSVQADLDGSLVLSAENGSGFRDECVAAIRQGTDVAFLDYEDALNTSSLYSACDIYLRDVDGNRNGIAQMDFKAEPLATFDIVLGANRPLDGDYTIRVEQMDWTEGCAYVILDGETEVRPLELGELVKVGLSATQNHTYTVGTLYVVPPTRAEVLSPGCESHDEAHVEVLPTGDGPWSISVTDENGTTLEGVNQPDVESVLFPIMASGEYTYTVTNEGTMTCGSMTETHTVVLPINMVVDMTVTHDCGEGGAAVAEIITNEDLEYQWSDGQEGPVAAGLEGGTYELIVTNAFACKDTVEVEILSAPQPAVVATNGECDGSVDASIALNSDDDTATWDVNVYNANGDLVDFAFGLSTPMTFGFLASGTYAVETQVHGDFGCAPKMLETTVIQPVPMTLTATSDVQCDEDALGTATATLVGGLGNVTYTWSNGTQGQEATALTAGTYTVTVTDEAGCEESAVVNVALSPQMEVTPMNPGCEGEGETGFAFNGEADVTWTIEVADADGNHVETLTTPGGEAEIAGLASGTYKVTYSNDAGDGCPAKTLEAELTEASNLVVDATTTPMECGDTNTGAIDLTVHGGIGDVDVTWEHGATGTSLTDLAGGQYYALVEDDNGCTKEVRVELEETPTVEARFDAPTGGLTDGNTGMTLTFTNTSEGNITGQTWYFGDTDTPSYDFHATHTFEEAGAYDVFLNVWNDKCSHTVRKTVVVSQGESNPIDDDLGTMVTSVMEGDLKEIHEPITTQTGWMMDLGAAAAGMKIHVFDLTGRQLCNPVAPDANGQIWVEGDQWPALVLLRLVHEPTNSIRTWKMVR
jgi:hypothetical protein